MTDKCKHCGNTFGLLETKTVIRKAIKPKGSPNRYQVVGYLCDQCEHHLNKYQNDNG